MLPQKLPLDLMTTQWASQLDPIIKNKLINGILLQNVPLISGNTVVNHKLGRKQVGYIITDINAAAVLYRSADLNDLTLTLNSSAACAVSLWCF